MHGVQCESWTACSHRRTHLPDLRISATINRTLTAADRHDTPPDARSFQRRWDSVIVLRATLQGVAIASLCVSLLN